MTTRPFRKGRLFLLAGRFARTRREADPLLQSMMARLGISKPRVAYVGAANGDDPAFFRRVGRMLQDAGAGKVVLVPVRKCGSADSYTGIDLVFLSGGDVEEGMRALASCGGDRILRVLFKKGMPFMGLSAGSIMLGRAWIRWRDPDDDRTAESFPCLGLASFVLDCHDEESGWEELRALLALSPGGTVGYGIPCNGGLMVSSRGRVEACGSKPARWKR